MSATMTMFDSLEAMKTLEGAGYDRKQAEATAALFSKVAALPDVSTLVTRAELKAELAENKSDILKWVLSAIAIQTIVILSAVVALVRFNH